MGRGRSGSDSSFSLSLAMVGAGCPGDDGSMGDEDFTGDDPCPAEVEALMSACM